MRADTSVIRPKLCAISRIHILLEPFQRELTADASLLRQVVNQLGHSGELDAVPRPAVVSPSVSAIGKDGDLIVALSTRHFFRYEVSDFGRVLDQFGVRRNIQRLFLGTAPQRIVSTVEAIEDDYVIGLLVA